MIKVFVYWNLNRKVWSVKALQGPNRGRVIQHLKEITLKNCIFKVSERGRQTVIAQKVKNVHAGVVGYMNSDEVFENGIQSIEVTYNPYKFSTFVNRNNTEESVITAKIVKMAYDRSVKAFI